MKENMKSVGPREGGTQIGDVIAALQSTCRNVKDDDFNTVVTSKANEYYM